MAKLTQDEMFRLIDRVTDFIYGLAGSQVEVHQTGDTFCITYKDGHTVNNEVSYDTQEYSYDSYEILSDIEDVELEEDLYDDNDNGRFGD